ncbi:response regulator [Halobacteriales archaeon QH_6_64_20]|nr:MAG: response regulator [Halobacteriales archaeon QH_6_64_20]
MASTDQTRVLLADDQAEIRLMLEAKFRQEGYEITAVEDGRECLDVLTDENTELPDLVILDVMMPRVDGFRALREIRETHELSIPVVMLTSRDQEEDTVRALDAGVTEYVTKPFSPRELIARLDRHL